MIRLVVGSFLVISHIYYAELAPTENYPYSEALASNYMLYWKYNDTHITFETHVQAHGFTGFGISVNGSMFPGDVIIGYVSHHNVHLNDYHTTAHAPPTMDSSQDWTLISSKENHDSTVLKFSRALNTHDSDDIPIHAGVTHVIWAYTTTDPKSPTELIYHAANRGSKDIKLIAKGTVPVGK
ncbi:DBH-like monooxygenase protein 1 homolog [Mercenaria mercenaria]|uniref:DBH-like monooxygenase protein 1 homolog n=1 Tax=Mercenaria mercenaria TaxID=6596 RepID=UPI00234EE939|nr:DBH-like monooxygenase protein 1 homolog [Mercenaria mercenaria]